MSLATGLRVAHRMRDLLESFSPVNNPLSCFMRPYNTNAGRFLAAASTRPMASYQKWFLSVGSSEYGGRTKGPEGLLLLEVGPVTRECSRFFHGHAEASPPGKRIRNVKLGDDEEVVEVEWSTGGVSKYPYVWLRDNCQCSMCYDSEYSNRLILTSDLDADIVPARVETQGQGKNLLVTWPDGHRSQYNWQWLCDRCFSPQARADREKHWKRQKQLWGANISANLSTFDFPALLSDDRALHDFLYILDTVGLVLVHNVSRDTGQVEKLANRVAFLKMSVYGTEYQVKNQPSDVGASIADSTGPLELHMDESYYNYTPGVMMLHFIQQTEGEGGASQLADGFNAAYLLKEENPEAFRLLNTFKVSYLQKRDKDKSHFRNRCHVISTDEMGEVQRVTYMTLARESFLDVPLDQVKPFYRAMKAFNDILYRPENHLHLKMKTGEMFVVDNRRVMHGRTAFNPADGVRHMQGGYLDWDEVYSRMRVLQDDLGIQE